MITKNHLTWLIIHKDGSQDAIYFHTPNPNGNNFPIKFKNIQWGMIAPALFYDLLPEGLDIGYMKNDYGKYHFVRSLGKGIPI